MSENQTTGKGFLIAATMLEKELAEALGVPKATVKRLRSEGKIPYVQIGHGRVIYIVESILDWLQSREIKQHDGGVAGNAEDYSDIAPELSENEKE